MTQTKGIIAGGTFGGSYLIFEPSNLAALLRGPEGPVARDMIRLAQAVKTEAKRRVGVARPDPVPNRRRPQRRPGTLRDSIVTRATSERGEFVMVVGSGDKIALMHHEGTPAHDIYPRTGRNRAGRLVFYSRKAGRIVYMPHGKPVHHPGTHPNRYLTDTLSDVIRGS